MSRFSYISSIFKLAWPIWITQAIQTAMVTIDLLMSAQVSEADMAAVGTALSIWHPIYFFSMGVIMVLSPLLSKSYGESNLTKLTYQLAQGIWLAGIVCIFSLGVLTLSAPILSYLKLATPLIVIGQEYLLYLAVGLPFICLTAVLRYLNEAVGQTKPLMLISLCGVLINIPLNYLFIYGSSITPAFGGAGCGIATSIVNILILIALWQYSRKGEYTQKILALFRFSPLEIREVILQLKIGVPIGLTIFMEIALFAAIALAIATHGTSAAAAHQIALNVTTNFYMIPLSIGMATTVLIGQNVGRNKPLDAKTVAYSAISMAFIFATCSCALIYLSRPWLIPYFSDDPQVFAIASLLLFWAAVFQYPDALQTVISSSLRGYADTQKPMYFVLFAYWCVGFPYGYIVGETDWLVAPQGVSAYWQGLLISLSSAAVLLTVRLFYFWNKQCKVKSI
ncbi:MATE family efflux transporter [Catenovulum sediminis]|uniref:Multidrug-efflux transporter n=1 Tax=Catenovulum sediminis TaxID=1740262 RepID=A0ABV1RIX2_9ALTE